MKQNSLSLAMLAGGMLFGAWKYLPFSVEAKEAMVQGAERLQPLLIFCMLLLSCCKVELKHFCWQPWQGRLLAIQAMASLLLGMAVWWGAESGGGVLLESAMLCVMMPTATAAAVVAGKLNGNLSEVITYTILSNFLSALLVSVFAPLLGHHPELGFFIAFKDTMLRVAPLLLVPFLLSVLIQKFFPKLLLLLLYVKDLPFLLWCVCLAISIALAMKTLFAASLRIWEVVGVALSSLLVCFLSFYVGRKIGKKSNKEVEASQSLGQKNTALGIWIAYTFLTPVTSIAGGFYAIWHNLYNAHQMAQHRKKKQL